MVDQMEMVTVRGGGWQTVVFSGQTEVLVAWLVLPGHFRQGLVRVVVLVMCSVMILGVGHIVMDAAVPDEVLGLEVTFLLELVFAEELVFLLELVLAEELVRGEALEDVALRKDTELEMASIREEEAVPTGGMTGPEDIACEEVPTDTGLDETSACDDVTVPLRTGAELDAGTAIEREDWMAAELVSLRRGAALDNDSTGAGELVGTSTGCDEV